MAGQFTAVALFLILGAAFVLFNFFLASILRPKHPNPVKQDIYECGELTTGSAWIQFNIRFYLYALAFVIFDVEAVFLLPWALVYKSLGLFAFIEMLVFLTILIFALWYAWKKDALQWF